MSDFIYTNIKFDGDQRKRFDDRLQEIIEALPDGSDIVKVSEFVKIRELPNDTPYPGPWQHERTPLFVEIMDCLSVDSPIDEVAILKSAQDGVTAAICENGIAYTIKHNPGPILYVTANDKLARMWYDARFIPLLNSCKLDGLVEYQHKTKRKTKSGATANITHFPGGFFILGSGQSPASLRSFPCMVVILDEISKYPAIIKSEGDATALAEARTTNYPNRRKIVYMSTPSDFGVCPITNIFLQGDQRYPFIKCPHCSKEIVMEFSPDFAPYHEKNNLLEKEFGLVWKMDGRQLINDSIGYRCVECGDVIKQYQKYDLLQKAKWHPTSISRSKTFRSYSFSGLYSLLSNWETIVSSWLKVGNNEARKQTFVNTKLGLSYRVQTNKPKFAALQDLKGNYHEREIPHGVLFLTASVDIQQGSRTNPDYPPRLEMEVCGFGRKYKSWSIEYKKFIGSIDDYEDGAWLELRNYFKDNFIYTRDDGVRFKPVLVALDAGNPQDIQNVYAMARLYNFCYPVMGSKPLTRKQGLDDVIDESRHRDYDPFRITKSNEQQIVLITTNHYKRAVYKNLCVERQLGEQKPYFCEFPLEYTEKYFRDLVVEEMTVNGDFVLPSGKHNEPLDLRVYNLCMHDVFFFLNVMKIRRQYEAQGYSKEETEMKIKSPYVINLLEKNIEKQAKRLGS